MARSGIQLIRVCIYALSLVLFNATLPAGETIHSGYPDVLDGSEDLGAFIVLSGSARDISAALQAVASDTQIQTTDLRLVPGETPFLLADRLVVPAIHRNRGGNGGHLTRLEYHPRRTIASVIRAFVKYPQTRRSFCWSSRCTA
jgi:hypothetical protein